MKKHHYRRLGRRLERRLGGYNLLGAIYSLFSSFAFVLSLTCFAKFANSFPTFLVPFASLTVPAAIFDIASLAFSPKVILSFSSIAYSSSYDKWYLRDKERPAFIACRGNASHIAKFPCCRPLYKRQFYSFRQF